MIIRRTNVIFDRPTIVYSISYQMLHVNCLLLSDWNISNEELFDLKQNILFSSNEKIKILCLFQPLNDS